MRRLLLQSRPLRKLAAAVTVLCLTACSEPPTRSDQHRLELLKQQFAGRYEFALEPPHYLRVTSLTDSSPNIEDLRAIYKVFWLDPIGQPRIDSDYVYLNAYDKVGQWTLQLYWDPAAKRLVEGRGREHY